MSNGPVAISQPKRIVSVDQLRGYAIFGMLLVNASGLFFEPIKATLEGTGIQAFFDTCLYQLTHHRSNYSYADTIAPLFVFGVGMGMRLSWLRRSEIDGIWQTRKAMLKRYTVMVLIAFAIYAGWLWDALMDIGLAGILAIMLIDKKPRVRVIAAFAFVLAYQLLFMFSSYGTWMVEGKFSLENPDYVPFLVQLVPLQDQIFGARLNGGPLGPLSWVMMLLLGSYAYDVMSERNEKKFMLVCAGWGLGLCAMGYVLHIEWPGVKEAWPFSARNMTAPFPLWSSGFCFLQLLVFYIICDKLNVRIPTFTSIGMNPLVFYIAQCLFLDVAERFAPEQLSMLAGLTGFAILWAIFSLVAYYMHKKKIFIKL